MLIELVVHHDLSRTRRDDEKDRQLEKEIVGSLSGRVMKLRDSDYGGLVIGV
jgi:hypothetical protein